jgi:sulfatase maturation enzyme AslB (radical SAM superfamily)
MPGLHFVVQHAKLGAKRLARVRVSTLVRHVIMELATTKCADFGKMFDKINRLSIEFTKKCNMDCAYCHQIHSDSTLTMPGLRSRVKFINSLNNLSDINVDFSLTGGEVTVETSKFFKYHEYLYKNIATKNKTFSMMSNMTNIEPVFELLDSGILREDRVGFSWDGINTSKSRISKYGDKYFVDQLEKISKTKYRNTVFIQISLYPDVIPNLSESIRALLGMGLKNIGTYIVRGYNYTEKDAATYDEEMEKISRMFVDSYLNDSERMRYFEFTKCWIDYIYRKDMPVESTTKCHKIGNALHIALDDKIYPCIYFGDHELFSIGDMKSGLRMDSMKKFEDQYNCAPICIERKNCTIKHCSSCEAVNYDKRGHLCARDESHCKMREVERTWFARVIKYLSPYITDHSLETYWRRVHEQAINPRR